MGPRRAHTQLGTFNSVDANRPTASLHGGPPAPQVAHGGRGGGGSTWCSAVRVRGEPLHALGLNTNQPPHRRGCGAVGDQRETPMPRAARTEHAVDRSSSRRSGHTRRHARHHRGRAPSAIARSWQVVCIRDPTISPTRCGADAAPAEPHSGADQLDLGARGGAAQVRSRKGNRFARKTSRVLAKRRGSLARVPSEPRERNTKQETVPDGGWPCGQSQEAWCRLMMSRQLVAAAQSWPCSSEEGKHAACAEIGRCGGARARRRLLRETGERVGGVETTAQEGQQQAVDLDAMRTT